MKIKLLLFILLPLTLQGCGLRIGIGDSSKNPCDDLSYRVNAGTAPGDPCYDPLDDPKYRQEVEDSLKTRKEREQWNQKVQDHEEKDDSYINFEVQEDGVEIK